MTINKTGIDWCDYTFNIASGCVNGCKYCYARKIALHYPKVFPFGFEPTVHLHRKFKSPKKPSIIFLDSMFDVFGDCEYQDYEMLPDKSVKRIQKLSGSVVFSHLIEKVIFPNPQHKFLFLSKNAMPSHDNPEWDFGYPNIYFGFSLTKETANKLTTEQLAEFDFFSCEPFDYEVIVKNSDIFRTAKWIILGCQTKPEIMPDKSEVQSVIEYARNNMTEIKCEGEYFMGCQKPDGLKPIPVFVKEPMATKLGLHIQEYPEFLKPTKRS